VVGGPVGEVGENAAARDEHCPQPSQEIDSPRRRAGGTDYHGSRRCDSPAAPAMPGAASFQRGLLGAGIALVIAAVIALRALNVRVADMAPGADDNQALPVPVAGGPAPEAPHFPAGRAGLPRVTGPRRAAGCRRR
jgi:hypothetical protein